MVKVRAPYHFEMETVSEICPRCRELFTYRRKTQRRIYCPPCAKLEKSNGPEYNNAYYLNVTKPKRIAARAAAKAARRG